MLTEMTEQQVKDLASGTRKRLFDKAQSVKDKRNQLIDKLIANADDGSGAGGSFEIETQGLI